MLLAALALPALTAVGLSRRSRLVAVLALIAVYVPLAGAGPSIQRAGIMGAAGLLAALAGRPASRAYALLLAAAITLALDPRAGADPGWQLSFAAVVAIFALAPGVRSWLTAHRVPAGVAEAGAVTLAATAGTAPLLAFHFGRLSLVTVPANLLAVAAVAPVMWLGMLSAAAGELAGALHAVLGDGAAGAAVGPLPPLINALAGFPLGFLAALAEGAGALPGADVPLSLGSPLALAGVYAALAVAWRVRRVRGPALAAGAVLLAAALAAARPPPAPRAPEAFTVSFLDVGQGDATLIQDGSTAILVDTGPPDGPILGRLREAGVRRIDVLVVTHAQDDHDGGAPAVAGAHEVGVVLDGAAGAATAGHRALAAVTRRRHVPRVPARAGQRLRAGRVELRVLWPRADAPSTGDLNDRAVVAHLRAGAFDLLLPADAESGVTAALDLPRVEALKVAHHGSADPGLPGLIERLRPAVAVISCGRGNSYGHPTPQGLAALRAVSRVGRTDREGTVRLTVRGRRMTVATAR